jgi:response regulator RpfG family c-di-GMP phosphodiesterase
MSKTEQVPALEIDDRLAQVSSKCRPAARVLAVDDEPAACKLLSLILAPPAFYCTTASNGEEALAYLNREHFDAVISDLHMPGINGLKLLTEVHQLHPHIAFLVVTGVDEVDVGVQGMRNGADNYLVKPLRESAVIASLDIVLHQRKLELQIEEYRLHLEEMVEQRAGQLQKALKQIEHSYEDTLQALGAAIDLRDNETAGHSQRVCRYSLEIAHAMGWTDKQLQSLAREHTFMISGSSESPTAFCSTGTAQNG